MQFLSSVLFYSSHCTGLNKKRFLLRSLMALFFSSKFVVFCHKGGKSNFYSVDIRT